MPTSRNITQTEAPEAARSTTAAADAPPSEEAYVDAMSRHGTPEWTDADEQIVERYLRHRTTK